MLRNAVHAVLVSSCLVLAGVACGPCGSDSDSSAIVVNVTTPDAESQDELADQFPGSEAVGHRMTGFSGLGDASVDAIGGSASGCLSAKPDCSVGGAASSDCRIADKEICGTYDCEEEDCSGDCSGDCKPECPDTPAVED